MLCLPARGAPIVEMRKRNDRREVPGRVGRVWGGRPEALACILRLIRTSRRADILREALRMR